MDSQGTLQMDATALPLETDVPGRLQAELDMAQRIQSVLFPQAMPPTRGLDIFAKSLPASQIGGDFYDFIYPSRHSMLFTVGDISGKGIPAALLTAMVLKVIRTSVRLEPEPTPELILQYANADVYHEFSRVGMFATAFFGQYDLSSRTLRFANAGHAPVIYRPARGAARMVPANSMPIGVQLKNKGVHQELPLGPEDLLIVATDGFTDTQSCTNEMFGYDRLLNLTDALADYSAEKIGQAFFHAVRIFGAGHPQNDDQTVVVLKGMVC